MSTSLLSSIHSPEDLTSLNLVQLQQLATEIRHRIIDVVSVNGGHLGSNLGIVELTLALHFVFRSPIDSFIFDVSHQTYIHKLLTGRQDKFSQIRKYKGLCGFCHPKESPHDHFFSGHAGTALSLALGVCKARDLTHSQGHVIPILGDASLTCGLTLEALNNIPKDLQKMIVILNDNKMSISQNVGAITHILSRFLSNPTSNKIFHEVESFLGKIPNLGGFLAQKGQKLTESLKNLVSTAPFFEQFGLSYVGPVDGHDIGKLIDTLTALKDNPKPTLLHVLTTKGKGMETAINNPTSYHGCRPFNKETGMFHPSSCPVTFPQIFGKHILALAQENPDLVAVTPAMPAGSCLEAFMEKFPSRCLDVGIAEGHAVTFCGALAKNKQLKVVCSIYSTFLQRALDNLFHDVCLQESPVIFAIDRGGISGPDGSTHHGIYEMSFLQSMPHMVICQPRNGQLLKELLESSLSWNLPTAIRYPNLPTEEASSPLQNRELGKGEVLVKGEKLLLIGLGHMSLVMLQVQKLLQSQQIEATVVDPIFVKPIDSDLFLELFATHSHVVTLEEHAVQGGFASAFQSFLSLHPIPHLSLLHLGIPDRFVEQGSHAELLAELKLTPEDIYETIVHKWSSLLQPMLAGLI